MRKGLGLVESNIRYTESKSTSWRLDLMFPALLVGMAYLVGQAVFGL